MWPYGPFQNKNKIYFLLTKLKQISYIKKKSPFQNMQMTYALNCVLYDIGSWHMGTIIKSFVLWDLSFFFFFGVCVWDNLLMVEGEVIWILNILVKNTRKCMLSYKALGEIWVLLYYLTPPKGLFWHFYFILFYCHQ